MITKQEAEYLKNFYEVSEKISQEFDNELALKKFITSVVTEKMGFKNRQQPDRLKRTLQAMRYINKAGTNLTEKGIKYVGNLK